MMGIGAVFSHRIDGIELPVYLDSLLISAPERNYSQPEKEAIALVLVL